MARILGIDYGRRRVGIAKSDETETIATGLETITYQQPTELLEKLAKIIREHEIASIVIGRPIALDGSARERAREVDEFAARLANQVNLPVDLYDERLSTIIAQQTIREQGKQPSRNKALIDKISAVVLLESYLERKRCAR